MYITVAMVKPNGKITGIQSHNKKLKLPEDGEHLFLEIPVGFEESIRDVYCEAGEFKRKPNKPSPHHVFDYTTKQWIDPRTPETEWPLVRAERDRRLLASDWTQLPDVPLATKEAWATYRQALRDITEQADPFNIVWPTLPQ